MSHPRPTLLVFTLGPSRESARRHLLPAHLSGYELRLHRACLDSVLEAGRSCGCRILVSAPQKLDLPSDVRLLPQKGAGFAQRLASAVAMAESEGGPLIVVGSDVPELTGDHLRSALAGLSEVPEKVVLGPATDGGIYLLAARQPVADRLADIPWGHPDTLSALEEVFLQAGRPVTFLSPLADLDQRSDLERWLAVRRQPVPGRRHVWYRLRALLAQLLAVLRRPFAPHALGQPLAARIPVRPGRAPPSRLR